MSQKTKLHSKKRMILLVPWNKYVAMITRGPEGTAFQFSMRTAFQFFLPIMKSYTEGVAEVRDKPVTHWRGLALGS